MTANLPFWNLVGNDKILLCVKLFTERKSCFCFFNSELSGFLAFHGLKCFPVGFQTFQM